MWNPADNLVQIELGSALARPVGDEPGMLRRALGGPQAPGHAEYSTAVGALRNALWAQGVQLPVVSIRPMPDLPPYGVRAYVGLDEREFQARGVPDIVAFLAGKAREYQQLPFDRSTVRSYLTVAVDAVRRDDYQTAFEHCQAVYYRSFMGGWEYELVRCLLDAGNVRLRNGQLAPAYAALDRAAKLANAPNVVDASLRCQASLSVGNVCKLMGALPQAWSHYAAAANVAHASGNSSLLFLAYCDGAEVSYQMGLHDRAVEVLRYAINLVLSEPGDGQYELAFKLQSHVSHLQGEMLQAARSGSGSQARQHAAYSAFKRLYLLAEQALVRSLVGGAVFKVLGVGTASVLTVFGHSQYTLDRPSFFGPTHVGDRTP